MNEMATERQVEYIRDLVEQQRNARYTKVTQPADTPKGMMERSNVRDAINSTFGYNCFDDSRPSYEDAVSLWHSTIDNVEEQISGLTKSEASELIDDLKNNRLAKYR